VPSRITASSPDASSAAVAAVPWRRLCGAGQLDWTCEQRRRRRRRAGKPRAGQGESASSPPGDSHQLPRDL